MFTLKRFLLLGSIAVVLLAGLMYTVYTRASTTAFAASTCNTIAEGRFAGPNWYPEWNLNCPVDQQQYTDSKFTFSVQEIINAMGICGTVSRNGQFGSGTEKAVKCFQKWSGFSSTDQTGIVDTSTWIALEQNLELVNNNPGGWDTYTAFANSPTEYVDFRMYDDSEIWYVNVGPLDGSAPKWCRMDVGTVSSC
jgi:peptidoglycan hydrolase-like protein with peptidoglycan-binding domain